jgi:hypothetical protein
MSILGLLFSGEERIMIKRAAVVIWEREHTLGPSVDKVDRKFSLENLHWYNNDLDDREKMRDLRNLIIKVIKESVL